MKNKKWNVATVDALMLSLITILYAILGTLLIPKGFLAVLLWIIKFVSTIWLLIYFIKDYAKESEVFTYKDGFGFAFLVSFLSSLFVGVYYYLHYAFIFPDDIQMVADTINQAMAARGGDTSVVDKIIDNLSLIHI